MTPMEAEIRQIKTELARIETAFEELGKFAQMFQAACRDDAESYQLRIKACDTIKRIVTSESSALSQMIERVSAVEREQKRIRKLAEGN